MIYGADVKLPGMLNAAIKDCPVFGGKLKSYDEAKVMGMKGVKKVVRVSDSTVAVVADTWWHAKTALDALPIVWDEGENAKVSSEFDRQSGWPKASTMRSRLTSATRTATPRPRLPAPSRRSKRSTTIPTRTTPRWSR